MSLSREIERFIPSTACEAELMKLLDDHVPDGPCGCLRCAREEVVRSTSRLAAVLGHEGLRRDPQTWALERRAVRSMDDPMADALDLQARVKEWRELARKRYPTTAEIATVVELGPRSNHPHVHVALLGSNFRLRTVRAFAWKVGLELRVERDRRDIDDATALACYLMKIPLSSLLMSDADARTTLEFSEALNPDGYPMITPAFAGDVPGVISSADLHLAADELEGDVLHFVGTFAFSKHLPPLLTERLSADPVKRQGCERNAEVLAEVPIEQHPITDEEFAEFVRAYRRGR